MTKKETKMAWKSSAIRWELLIPLTTLAKSDTTSISKFENLKPSHSTHHNPISSKTEQKAPFWASCVSWMRFRFCSVDVARDTCCSTGIGLAKRYLGLAGLGEGFVWEERQGSKRDNRYHQVQTAENGPLRAPGSWFLAGTLRAPSAVKMRQLKPTSRSGDNCFSSVPFGCHGRAIQRQSR